MDHKRMEMREMTNTFLNAAFGPWALLLEKVLVKIASFLGTTEPWQQHHRRNPCRRCQHPRLGGTELFYLLHSRLQSLL